MLVSSQPLSIVVTAGSTRLFHIHIRNIWNERFKEPLATVWLALGRRQTARQATAPERDIRPGFVHNSVITLMTKHQVRAYCIHWLLVRSHVLFLKSSWQSSLALWSVKYINHVSTCPSRIHLAQKNCQFLQIIVLIENSEKNTNLTKKY